MSKNLPHKNDFHDDISWKKSFINKFDEQKRLNFAKKYVNKEFFKQIIFSDEIKFNITFDLDECYKI